MSIIEGLEGVSILREIVFRWLDCEDVGRLDSAACNLYDRDALLSVLKFPVLRTYLKGDKLYHRSVSKLCLMCKYDLDESPDTTTNELIKWCVAKLSWCLTRDINITSLLLQDIDLANSLHMFNCLNLNGVIEIEIVEKTVYHYEYYYPDLDRNDLLVPRLFAARNEAKRSNNLSDMINKCPQLTALVLDNSVSMCFECVVQVKYSILRQLIKLHIDIRLEHTSMVDLIEHLAEHCVALIVIDISSTVWFDNINPDSNEQCGLREALVQLIKNNPQIEDYSHGLDARVTSSALIALTENCKKLKYVRCTVIFWEFIDFDPLTQMLNSCSELIRVEVLAGDYQCDILYSKSTGMMIRCHDVMMPELMSMFRQIMVPLNAIRLWGLRNCTEELFVCIAENSFIDIGHVLTLECRFSFDEQVVVDILRRCTNKSVSVQHLKPNRLRSFIGGGLWRKMCMEYNRQSQK